ncbi:MAG: hypothetical protein AAGD11_12815 [Planctomycetota bacterium]
MAAQDLQIRPKRAGYLAPQTIQAPVAMAANATPEVQPALLTSALKRRWWLFLIIAGISAFAAREVMLQFGKDSSISTASLIHTGLPNAPGGGEVIKPMAPTTCAELIKSTPILSKLCDVRGLAIPPKNLQELIETQTSRGSSLLNIEMTGKKAKETIDNLNGLMEIFVEEVARQRKQTLRNHMNHVENALLESRAEVADARQRIFEVQSEQQKVLEEGGVSSERYRSIFASVANTQLAIDEKRVEQVGVMQQIEAIQRKGDALESRVAGLIEGYRSQVASKAANQLRRLKARLNEGSRVYVEVMSLADQVQAFATSATAPNDPQQWQVDLYSMISNGNVALPQKDLDEIVAVFDGHSEALSLQLREIDGQRLSLLKQQEQLELSAIPIKNQIRMLESRLKDYQAQADEIGEQLTGIGADQYGAYELRLEQAENQQKALTAQLENMSQLEKCRVMEWSVSMPASAETTSVSSNGTKLFALAFGVCGLVLSAPVLASEWYRQQTPPQVAFANSLHLPVLADRILQDFAPRRRSRIVPAKLTEEQSEVVRMLALRIQQSSHSDGSVMLFSSIDPKYSPAPLMASVAECLAQREEKVLIVDAICPDKSRLPITNVVPMPEHGTDAEPQSEVRTDYADHPGLSEYFSSGCDSVSDLIRPTGCPGVDLIGSGHAAFPREALASSSLTELVEQCRENYTMILVNSPAATNSADLQMLTARADGIVLMATKEVRNNPHARAAVSDLIELGAPIIGVVA